MSDTVTAVAGSAFFKFRPGYTPSKSGPLIDAFTARFEGKPSPFIRVRNVDLIMHARKTERPRPTYRQLSERFGLAPNTSACLVYRERKRLKELGRDSSLRRVLRRCRAGNNLRGTL